MVGLLIGLVPFNYQMYHMLEMYKKNQPEGYEFPEMSDFKVTAYWTVFFIGCELVLKNMFWTFFIPHCKEQKDLELQEFKCKKAVHNLFKSLYFIVAVAWGYKICLPEPWFPTSLGGSGDITLCYVGYPYQKQSPELSTILLCLSGYHIGGFITHFFGPRKSDFVEMGLHHLCAIYLYTGCYIANGQRFGQTVALLHDLADIFVGFTKMFVETNYKMGAYISMGSVMVIWLYTRVLIFPTMIWKCWFRKDIMPEYPFNRYFLCVLMLCMWILHCFWFTVFIKMIQNAKKGKIEDIQNKAKIEETLDEIKKTD